MSENLYEAYDKTRHTRRGNMKDVKRNSLSLKQTLKNSDEKFRKLFSILNRTKKILSQLKTKNIHKERTGHNKNARNGCIK